MVKKEIITFEGTKLKKEAFLIEESHPAIGRIFIVDGKKYKVLDEAFASEGHANGTFIKAMTPEDEENIKEYDEALDTLVEKLKSKVDISRMIKETIKTQPLQDIKMGLYILKAEEDGEPIETEHHRGCYEFKIHYKNATYSFASGNEVMDIR